MSAIAALFVDSTGVYSTLNVDCWSIERDARRYPGPHPVVAHPPCQLWINLAHVNYKRYGGEHNRPGNDGDCFWFALRAVQIFGGVLEHPAGSKAWPRYSLLRPEFGCWTQDHDGSWVTEVWQSAYGHKARKRTWLYYVGNNVPADAKWARLPGTHQCGWFDRAKPTLSKKEASATPIEFAEYLISLARSSR